MIMAKDRHICLINIVASGDGGYRHSALDRIGPQTRLKILRLSTNLKEFVVRYHKISLDCKQIMLSTKAVDNFVDESIIKG